MVIQGLALLRKVRQLGTEWFPFWESVQPTHVDAQICAKAVNELEAEQTTHGVRESNMILVSFGKLLNLLPIEEKKLRNASRDQVPEEVVRMSLVEFIQRDAITEDYQAARDIAPLLVPASLNGEPVLHPRLGVSNSIPTNAERGWNSPSSTRWIQLLK
jgi:hypothetical protein